ncbi:MAG: SDR family oxidoreductase [Planctomycetota bacterium]|nr:SDR family oxidoreductase [Planctomycetota bacterium]
MNANSLSGKTAVVTGTASGIGRSVAIMLANNGAQVFGGDIAPTSGNDTTFTDLNITTTNCDVTAEQDVIRLIEMAADHSGTIDVLVNNAGVGMVKQIPDVSEEDWDYCMGVNLKGPFLCSKHAISYMRDGGSIINISSNAGLLPRAHDPIYSTSKGALIALTRSLALCHSPDQIRVNAVCPGPVGDTVMMDQGLQETGDPSAAYQATVDASPIARAAGRMIHVDEIASAVLYLAGDSSLMVTGTSIAIDGGKSLGVPPAMVADN